MGLTRFSFSFQDHWTVTLSHVRNTGRLTALHRLHISAHCVLWVQLAVVGHSQQSMSRLGRGRIGKAEALGAGLRVASNSAAGRPAAWKMVIVNTEETTEKPPLCDGHWATWWMDSDCVAAPDGLRILSCSLMQPSSRSREATRLCLSKLRRVLVW